jgi:integrase/recombinase XerC
MWLGPVIGRQEELMTVGVRQVEGGYRLDGDWDGLDADAFLTHLSAALAIVNLARFLGERELTLAVVDAPLVLEWIDWQGVRRSDRTSNAKQSHSAAASTVNRRVAAVRALFEYLVMTGQHGDNAVPSPRRGQGLRRSERGLLGHLGPGRAGADGRLVRQPRLLPESLPVGEVEAFWRPWPRTGIGRWCWRCCWADCGRRRRGVCCWRMWTWDGGGCG